MFVTAVTGNYASYVSYHHTHATTSSGEAQAWYYDIDKVGGHTLWLAPLRRVGVILDRFPTLCITHDGVLNGHDRGHGPHLLAVHGGIWLSGMTTSQEEREVMLPRAQQRLRRMLSLCIGRANTGAGALP